ncbi:MAG: LCP family protein [Candidatus Geothermincolia bacterium]
MSENVGYRTQRRQQHQQKKSGLWIWLVAVVVVLVILFALLGAIIKVSPIDTAWKKTMSGFGWLGHQVKSAWPFKGSKNVAAAGFLPKGKKTANYLVAVTKQAGGATYLSTVVLASYDSRSKTGSLIFFPNDLLVAAPGMGSDQMSNLVELDGGKIDSTRVTVENLLGTQVDKYVLASDRDLRLILNQFGEKFTVTVPSKISYKDPSLNVTVDLKPGTQKLDSTKLASYLTYGPAGKSLDLVKRQVEYAPTLIGMMGSTDVNKFIAKNSNMFDTDASNKELAGILKTFNSLRGGGLQTVIVPVKEFRYEKTVVNRLDQAALPGFVKQYVKADSAQAAPRLKVELLNGCGVPGIGSKVSDRIDLTKFQIVNSANADNFDHPETLVIVYSDKKDVINAANELRNELEVGRVVSQPASQDLSDISVIIGKDYASK